MINIKDKSACCGCEACVQICPKQCINLKTDNEGFKYPLVDTNLCVDCGLCERVCPMLHSNEPVVPLATYAAVNPNHEICTRSSSGGVFSMLAEHIIQCGGVVYGAGYTDDWQVAHIRIENISALSRIRGSKYMQSSIGNSFRSIKRDLASGRQVLFSGTPCQVAGLKRFLKKDYDNLTTVDFVCHGVPSPGVWRSYLQSVTKNVNDISLVDMRSKSYGWKSYRTKIVDNQGVALVDEPFFDNMFMQAFLRNLILRPSCYSCPFKEGRSHSDITLGDFWGIEHIDPTMDSDNGVSLVLVNNNKGQALMSAMALDPTPEPYAEVVRHNPSVCYSVDKPAYRPLFMRIMANKGFLAAYHSVFGQSFVSKIRRRLWLTFNR